MAAPTSVLPPVVCTLKLSSRFVFVGLEPTASTVGETKTTGVVIDQSHSYAPRSHTPSAPGAVPSISALYGNSNGEPAVAATPAYNGILNN